MKRLFGVNSIRIIYIAFGLFIIAGLLVSAGMIGSLTSNFMLLDGAYLRVWDQLTSIAMGLGIFIIGLVMLNVWRRENEATELIKWLNEITILTSSFRYPITEELMSTIGNSFSEIFPDNFGWTVFAQIPGILTQNASERRFNIHISESFEEEQLQAWSVSYLGKLMGYDQSVGGIFECPERKETAMGIWVNRLKKSDISMGFIVFLDPAGSYPSHPLSNEIISSALGLFLHRVSVMLIDVIDSHSGLSDEGLGLIYRILGHEMLNELQSGFYETLEIADNSPNAKSKIDGVLWRLKHWIGILRDAPVIQESWIHQEDIEELCLDDCLDVLIEESEKAWPKISFEVTGMKDVFIVAGRHINSVIRNVLFNAGSFSPEGGTILVDVNTDDQYAYVSIIDQGPGVTEDKAKLLFQSPVKSSARPDGKKGTGIGLWAAKKIMDTYYGDLSCIPKNDKVDGGHFIVKVPISIFEDNFPMTFMAVDEEKV